jgi:hypothetical protein
MSAPQPRTRGVVWAWLWAGGRAGVSGWAPRIVMLAAIVAAIYVAPIAALLCWVVSGVLRRRPDRLIMWLTAAVFGLVVVVVWLAGPDYWAAYWRFRSAVQVGGAPPREAWPLLAWSLVIGPAAGGVWAAVMQWYRERQPMGGRMERELREQVEGNRKRRTTHSVQAIRYDTHARPGWHRSIVRPLVVGLGTDHGPIIGRRLAGDLRWPGVRGHAGLVVLPRTVPHLVLLGATRQGKSEIALRVMEWHMAHGSRVILLNCKEQSGNRRPALRLAAAAEQHGRTFRALVRDRSGWDPMRGTPSRIRQRWQATQAWGDEFYATVSNNVLTLALNLAAAEGRPLESLPEILRTLQGDRLRTMAARNSDAAALLGHLERDPRNTASVIQRWYSNAIDLSGWIAPASAGGWCWEDCEVAVCDLPTSTEPSAARMLVRAMLQDLEGWITDPERRDLAVPVLLVVEEISALDSDPLLGRKITNLVERAAGARVSVVVVAQGPSGLGDDRAIEALLTNSAVISCRQTDSAAVERLAGLSGTEEREEASAAYSTTLGVVAGAGSIRAQHGYRVKPDDIRRLQPGEAFILAEGRYAKIAAAMTEGGYRSPRGPAADALRSVTRPALELDPAPAVITNDQDQVGGLPR